MLKRLLTGSLVVTLVGICGLAHSDTLPATAGHIWCPVGTAPSTCNADTFCFQSSWSQVTNKCSATKKLIIPVMSRTVGTVPVSVIGPHANGTPPLCINSVQCRAVLNSATNGFVAQTGSSNFVCDTTSLGNLPVALGDTFHFDCDVPAGGQLMSVQIFQ